MHLTGTEIRERRVELHMSQTTLAEKVNISRQYLNKIESGTAVNVGDDIMKEILVALCVDCADTTLEAPVSVQIAKLRAGNESGDLSVDDCIRIGECILARTTDGSDIAAEVSLLMAPWYTKKMRYKEAAHCAFTASEYYTQTKDRVRWAKAYFEKANVDYCRGSFSSALEKMLLIETRLLTVSHDDPIVPRVLSSIAVIAAALHDFDLMADYIKKSEAYLEYVPESSRRSFSAKNWYLRGESYLKAGSFKDAYDAFSMSYCIYADLNDNCAALRMRNNMAEAHFKAGNLDDAESMVREVLEMKRKAFEAPTIIAESIILLAEIAHARKDESSALKHVEEILSMEGVEEGRVARALRIKARSYYRNGNMAGFNRHMAEAVQKLTRQHVYLKIEMMEEYIIANNLPMSFK